MKRAFLVLAISAWTAHAAAAGPSCMAQAAEKKLSGAAKTSFMKKCETDAKAACDASAQDKKLAGASKTSFLKKCAEDAVGGK
jgi:hypothetical protein